MTVMRAPRKDGVGLALPLRCDVYSVLDLFVMGLVIHVTDQASLPSHWLYCLGPFASAVPANRPYWLFKDQVNCHRHPFLAFLVFTLSPSLGVIVSHLYVCLPL